MKSIILTSLLLLALPSAQASYVYCMGEGKVLEIEKETLNYEELGLEKVSISIPELVKIDEYDHDVIVAESEEALFVFHVRKSGGWSGKANATILNRITGEFRTKECRLKE